MEVDEEGEEVDPREELVRKLLEYKMYKYMAAELKTVWLCGKGFLPRGRRSLMRSQPMNSLWI